MERIFDPTFFSAFLEYLTLCFYCYLGVLSGYGVAYWHQRFTGPNLLTKWTAFLLVLSLVLGLSSNSHHQIEKCFWFSVFLKTLVDTYCRCCDITWEVVQSALELHFPSVTARLKNANPKKQNQEKRKLQFGVVKIERTKDKEETKENLEKEKEEEKEKEKELDNFSSDEE